MLPSQLPHRHRYECRVEARCRSGPGNLTRYGHRHGGLPAIGRQQARFDGSDITVRTLAKRRRACAARGNL